MNSEMVIRLDHIEDEIEDQPAWASTEDWGCYLVFEEGWWIDPETGGRVHPVGDDGACLVIEIKDDHSLSEE